jgi:predicted  nucleic acid-binding Zn-ribbon protein
MVTTENSLRRAMTDVDDAQVEADPRVKKMRAEIAGVEREHAASARETVRLKSRLDGVDEGLVQDHRELSDLRDRLPQVCAAVLVGRGTPAEERKVLDRIAELERAISRARLGRPLVEAMVREQQARDVAPLVWRIEDLHRVLERLRQDVRTELARTSLA